MALYQARVSSPRAPAEVFEYLSDFSSVAEWDPGVVRARRLDAGPVRVNSLFDVCVSPLGRELELRYRVLDIDPPHRIVLEAEHPSMRSHDVIRVAPEGTGSRVDYDAQLDLAGAARAFDPMLQLGFDRVGRAAAEGLARALGGRWREEREGRTLVPCVWVTKEISASAQEAWARLVHPHDWIRWSPSLDEVECDDVVLGPESRGRVRPAYGVWLPFAVEGFRPGQEWSWRVAGLPATRHRVQALGRDRCRVEIGVPLMAAPYLAVCREALDRLADSLQRAAGAPTRAASSREWESATA